MGGRRSFEPSKASDGFAGGGGVCSLAPFSAKAALQIDSHSLTFRRQVNQFAAAALLDEHTHSRRSMDGFAW